MGIRIERRTGYPVLPAGVAGDHLVYDAAQPDGVRWASSGGDARFAVYERNIGAGDALPITITHGLNSRSVKLAMVRKNIGVAAPLTSVLQGAEILVANRLDPADPFNKIIVEPDEAWGVDEFHAVVEAYLGSSDITAPTAPVIAYGTITANTVALTATGATDAVGVVLYNWFNFGSYIGTSSAASFTATGLASGTPQSFQVAAVDSAGNQSALSNTVTPSTSAGPAVAFDAVGPYVQAAASTVNGVVSTTITVGSGANRILVVACETSHLNAINYPSGFSVVSCVSDNGGALTLLDFATIGTVNAGHVFLYYMLNPPTGVHNITFTTNSTPSSNWQDFVRIAAASYANVGSIVARAKRSASGVSAALAAAVTSAVGNMAVLHVASATSAITLTAGTNRANGGADGNGSCDFLRLADAAGAATVNFTGSNSVVHAYVSADLVKAA